MKSTRKVSRMSALIVAVAAAAALASGCSSGAGTVLGNAGAPSAEATAGLDGASAAPVESGDSAGATLPSDWPTVLPAPSAKLSIATVDPDGGVYAVWTAQQPSEELVAAYGQLLADNGFVKAGSTSIEGGVSADYTGAGYTVNITAVTDAGVTALTLTAVAGGASASGAPAS